MLAGHCWVDLSLHAGVAATSQLANRLDVSSDQYSLLVVAASCLSSSGWSLCGLVVRREMSFAEVVVSVFVASGADQVYCFLNRMKSN